MQPSTFRLFLCTGIAALGLMAAYPAPATADHHKKQASAEQAAVLAIGKPAPAFTATDSNGTSHSLADFKGKIVVLEWTNSECPFVRKHYDNGNMQKLQEDVMKAGGIWLSVISSGEGNQGFMTGEQANVLNESRSSNPTAVLLDASGELGKLYQAKTTPHMYVIAADGTLAYMGAIDSIPSANPADIEKAENYVTAAVTALKAGKPVATTTTKPYGCSVKYAD